LVTAIVDLSIQEAPDNLRTLLHTHTLGAVRSIGNIIPNCIRMVSVAAADNMMCRKIKKKTEKDRYNGDKRKRKKDKMVLVPGIAFASRHGVMLDRGGR
jgi:hypothetical protein